MAWCICLYGGNVIQFPNACGWAGTTLCKHAALNLSSRVPPATRANRVVPGTVVGVLVDMDHKSLAFKVNDGEWLLVHTCIT
jgi:hypothetical protein